jgi:transcriptional regulator GlxA family with amidase domain
VAVLALDGVMPFEMAIPHRVFGSAFDTDGNPSYDVRSCSLDGTAVGTTGDFAIQVAHDATVLAEAGTVVVPPAGTRMSPPDAPMVPAGLAEALSTMRSDARLVSLCGAAFLLATLGRLDGRPATTHWILSDEFRERFPQVDLDPDILFVDDGDVLTAAGSAAAIDLCLHLVRSDHGSDIANRVARYCVVLRTGMGASASSLMSRCPRSLLCPPKRHAPGRHSTWQSASASRTWPTTAT